MLMTIGPFSGEKVSEVKQKVVSWLVERGYAFTFYEVKAEKRPVLSRAGGKVIAAVLRDQWFINYDALKPLSSINWNNNSININWKA